MQIDLSGRTALVTGSTAGIGLATAEGLYGAGATVIVNGRGSERVDAAVELLGGGGERMLGVAGDAGTADGAEQLIAAVPAVDILVASLGIYEPRPVFEIPDAEWLRMFEVNVLSGIRLARNYVPAMAERGWGRVVFVSSESALHIPDDMVHYGVAKLALLGVARGLAQAVAGSGVTVNSILPGPTRTEGVETFLGQVVEGELDLDGRGGEILAEARPSSLVGRFLRPAEVASLAVYLCSEQASATTGAAMRADGGIVTAVV